MTKYSMSKDEPVGKKTGLAEQRGLAGTRGEKKELITSEKRGRMIRDLQGFCEVMQGEN